MNSLKNIKIIDEQARIFEATACVDMIDNTGIIVSPSEVAKKMDSFMARDAPLMEYHTNRKVGKILSWRFDELTVDDDLIGEAVKANPTNPSVPGIVQKYKGKTLSAITVIGQIHKDFPEDDAVWKKMKPSELGGTGEYRGISFGGTGGDSTYDEEHGGIRKNIQAIFEFSIVPSPRVAFALLKGINAIAQADGVNLIDIDQCPTCGEYKKTTVVEEQESLKKDSEVINTMTEEIVQTEPVPVAERPAEAAPISVEALASRVEALAKALGDLSIQVNALNVLSAAVPPVKEEAPVEEKPLEQEEELPAPEDKKEEAPPADEKPAEEEKKPVEQADTVKVTAEARGTTPESNVILQASINDKDLHKKSFSEIARTLKNKLK